jgi:hypothetical protein
MEVEGLIFIQLDRLSETTDIFSQHDQATWLRFEPDIFQIQALLLHQHAQYTK